VLDRLSPRIFRSSMLKTDFGMWAEFVDPCLMKMKSRTLK
jgi:hypothetical protein